MDILHRETALLALSAGEFLAAAAQRLVIADHMLRQAGLCDQVSYDQGGGEYLSVNEIGLMLVDLGNMASRIAENLRTGLCEGCRLEPNPVLDEPMKGERYEGR